MVPSHTLSLRARQQRRRTVLTLAVVIVSAMLGGWAGWWLASEPGPGDRHTLTRDIPLRA